MFFRYIASATALGCLSLFTPTVYAAEWGGMDFSGSGFVTLAAGKILNSGAPQSSSGFRCPCFVSDFAQAGVYQQGGAQWQPDSKLGFQGKATINPTFSLTGQVVLRAAAGGQADFEWLYGNVKLNDQLSLQLGRKRLPLLYHSESQDIGLTYPWVHLSPQIYGWEIVNYNGANVLYQGQWGDWAASMDVFGGNETVKDSGYWRMYNGNNTVTNSRWTNILGTDLMLSKDAFEARLVYIQSDLENTTPTAPNPAAFGQRTPQQIYGMTFNYESEHWVLRNEWLYINRKASYGEDFSRVFAAGYRVGKFLPMVAYNRYRQAQRLDPVAGYHPNQSEAHTNTVFLLRYDLTTASALKLQYDHWQNNALPQFFTANPNTAVPMGSANLLSVSYDAVF